MKIIMLIAAIFMAFILSSCATVFKGYDDEVTIYGTSTNIKVSTQDNIELKTVSKSESYSPPDSRYDKVVDVVKVKVPLDKNYFLNITDGDKNFVVQLNRKLGFWWFALDILLGGLPAVYDAITGAWYYYDDVFISAP